MRCKATNKISKTQCTKKASIDGYCSWHYNIYITALGQRGLLELGNKRVVKTKR